MTKPTTKNKKPKTLYAKKSLGQNFLVDQNYISKIISALNPQKNETIIEIGAGRGALTERLLESGADIFAVELDRDLIPFLQEKFAGNANFNLIEQDALKVDFSKFKIQNSKFKIKLAANLPYYISTAILQKLIEQRSVFSEMILMFQREVVERITAEAGNKERGYLTVLVEAYLLAEKLFDVPPTAFRPVPKIWSSVARFTPRDDSEIKIENESFFRQIVSAGFMQKRKTILNNLKNSFDLSEKNADLSSDLENLNINPKSRAEDLTVDEWKKLTAILIKKIIEYESLTARKNVCV
jgi:16S rRNA (adenine1518-N6/adenine1519-N6)-dimethyltransferase